MCMGVKLTRGELVLVNFVGQLGWALRSLDSWLNIFECEGDST